MAERRVLQAEKIAPKALATSAGFHRDVVDAVAKAVASDTVVVVGMAQNPFVKKVRRELTKAGVTFKYLEYGSYLSQWKQRLAIKMWSGWPTFPQVFLNGVLVGGCDDTLAELASGRFGASKTAPASAAGVPR